jgi:hypothetical protein
MIYILQISGMTEELSPMPMWSLVVSGPTFEEAVQSARMAMETHGLGGSGSPSSPHADALSAFIASLPDDCKGSFHCLDVLGQFQMTTENVIQKDSPHTRDAIIREIRRRNRSSS